MIRFVDIRRAIAIHGLQIAEHGGAPGIRDSSVLESALYRPVNIAAYEATEDVSRLGAAYLFGITKNHPFIDGNKRTALAVLGLFLAMNGYKIIAADDALYKAVLGIADGSLSEQAFAHWLEQNIALDRPR